jgi:hydroxypyruvate isomerase
MAGVRTGFAQLGNTAQFLSELSQVIDSAGVLGCKRIILVSGAAPTDMAPAQQQAGVADALRKAADLAGAASIELLIEPIDPFENRTAFLTARVRRRRFWGRWASPTSRSSTIFSMSSAPLAMCWKRSNC